MDRPESEAGMTRDVYALLAQANLLRMRGHWEEAAQSCMAALRLAPDSSSANSLLGDIYENQGRYDDAAQWYRMALDVYPDSLADRVKLDRLSRREEAQREQSRPAGILPFAEAALPPPGGLRRLLRDPEMILRYGALAAALGLMLVVACAYVVVHHAGALGLGGGAVVKSTPVVVAPLAGVLPADPDGAPARDPSEQALLTALQASHDLSRLGIVVYDVQVDPRVDGTAITFGIPASTDVTQAMVVRDALQVLQSASASGPLSETYTMRCLLVSSTGNSGPALVFVGDASQQAVQTLTAAGAALTDAQADAVFTNIWWSSAADVRA